MTTLNPPPLRKSSVPLRNETVICLDTKKQILRAYLPINRGAILLAFINPMRICLQRASEQRKAGKPLEVAFCKRLAQMVEIIDALLKHCDGTETHDKVAFNSTLADLRGLANDPEVLQQCKKIGTPEEEKEFADEAEVIAFVREFKMPANALDVDSFFQADKAPVEAVEHHAATTD